MPPETRSLWEQLDSEVEPWRRGRVALVTIGVFYARLQIAVLAGNILFGNFEGLLATTASCSVFWLLFYLIWIGINWVRWLAGAWCGLNGFIHLIWALTDSNGLFAAIGSINLIIGTYLCLSPSVYFFAKRQREKRSWLVSGIVVGTFVLVSVTFSLGTLGLFAYKAHAQSAAIEFAQDAAEHVYGDNDREWLLRHLTSQAKASDDQRSVINVFDDAVQFMGPVTQISAPTGQARVFYHPPLTLACEAHMVADGVSAYGHARLYFLLIDSGHGWQVQSTWWEHPGTPMPKTVIVNPQ
jgi:hypothetical protein